jgi:hypothetical protein
MDIHSAIPDTFWRSSPNGIIAKAVRFDFGYGTGKGFSTSSFSLPLGSHQLQSARTSMRALRNEENLLNLHACALDLVVGEF